jgi:hypothetical protein
MLCMVRVGALSRVLTDFGFRRQLIVDSMIAERVRGGLFGSFGFGLGASTSFSFGFGGTGAPRFRAEEEEGDGAWRPSPSNDPFSDDARRQRRNRWDPFDDPFFRGRERRRRRDPFDDPFFQDGEQSVSATDSEGSEGSNRRSAFDDPAVREREPVFTSTRHFTFSRTWQL